jgi:hypothetical protein
MQDWVFDYGGIWWNGRVNAEETGLTRVKTPSIEIEILFVPS